MQILQIRANLPEAGFHLKVLTFKVANGQLPFGSELRDFFLTLG